MSIGNRFTELSKKIKTMSSNKKQKKIDEIFESFINVNHKVQVVLLEGINKEI